MAGSLRSLLENTPIQASAPCRIDMGGTVDIPAFIYAMRHLDPITFNMALDMRTHVRLSPHVKGRVKVSSKGFESAEFELDQAPFDHPLGLMLSLAVYFRASGVHIEIHSDSPPRSALGGSSVAAVAVAGALAHAGSLLGEKPMTPDDLLLVAHALESQTAGVLCGYQDHLAAAHGKVHAWRWVSEPGKLPYKREEVLGPEHYEKLSSSMLLAYCGVPHDSLDVNGEWVRGFLSGKTRGIWARMTDLTREFINSLSSGSISRAVEVVNEEMGMRLELTPGVLTPETKRLVDAAMQNHCAGRFTGAGGGGCVWALGDAPDIRKTQKQWEEILSPLPGARLLPVRIDPNGILAGEAG